MRHARLLAATAALALTLSACDDGNEARIVELEGQLQTAQSEAEALRTNVTELETVTRERDQLLTELETVNARVVELEAAQGGAPAEASADVQGPMTTAAEAIVATRDQLEQLEQALAAEGFTQVSLDPIRQNLEQAGTAIAEVANSLGVEPGSTGSPAAAPEATTVPTEVIPAPAEQQ